MDTLSFSTPREIIILGTENTICQNDVGTTIKTNVILKLLGSLNNDLTLRGRDYIIFINEPNLLVYSVNWNSLIFKADEFLQ